MQEKISIIGAGSWGTTLGILLSRKGIDVELHSVFREHNLKMQQERQNRLFLEGVEFPHQLKINLSLRDTLSSKLIIIAIPVKFVRKILKRIKRQRISLKTKVFVSVSKGIEVKSLKRVSEMIKEELGRVKIAVLSGPNIAREVLIGLPTATVIACKERRIAKELQVLFTAPAFRVYLHQDLVGVELGGALKNIVALACGISDGLGFGTNTKAALITRGLTEIMKLGKKMGAAPSTFGGLTGLGDLVTTCFSSCSRNRFVGEEVAKGRSLKDILGRMNMVAEGIETVESAYKLSKKLNIDMPITSEVYHVLYKNKSPKKAVEDLMKRPLRQEGL